MGINNEIECINLHKSIKSKYILQQIFSFLEEKKKLTLINHNKKIQNMLDKNVNDYKIISGIGIFWERNGIGREYKLNSIILIFKGEFINGKRNGDGIEYHSNGMVKFKGKYVNGIRIKGKGYNENGKKILEISGNGKGKEYYKNEKLQFEDKYLDGKKWNGKGYNYNGELEYEIKNGTGKVKEYDYYGKLIFVGDYINGERKYHRKGIL